VRLRGGAAACKQASQSCCSQSRTLLALLLMPAMGAPRAKKCGLLRQLRRCR
jgi:hypothetical protein